MNEPVWIGYLPFYSQIRLHVHEENVKNANDLPKNITKYDKRVKKKKREERERE